MGFINDGTLKDWQNGETVQATDYKRERELLRIAINDNFQRVKNAADSVTGVTEETKEIQTLLSSLQLQIDNLDDMYSTDAERIAAINEVIKQFEIADGKLENLINNKANKSDVYTKVESDARYMQGIPDKSITRQKLADDFISEIDTAKAEAHTEAVYAHEKGDYAKAQGDRAKALVDEIESGSGVVSVNNKQGVVVLNADDVGAIPADQKGVAGGVATINEAGQVLDGNGNPVEGKVKTVNNNEPDETGNVAVDVQTPADNALKAANEYTDQAIANANQGEVKMVYYPYLIKATTDNQTEFTIPLETFDSTNDFLQVVQNTTVLNKEEHYTVTGKTIILNQGVATGTSLFITIIKNTLVGAEGAVNGNLIKDGSLPLNKLAEQIPTLDVNGNVLDGNGNIVEGKVKTVNNTQPDENGNVSISIPTKTSELTNDSNFATIENVNVVSTNLENHESKIASTTDLGHVRVDGKTITIDETGVISSVGGGYELVDSNGLAKPFSGDLNDLTESGWYEVRQNATHAPSTFRQMVNVTKGANMLVQTSYIQDTAAPSTKIFERIAYKDSLSDGYVFQGTYPFGWGEILKNTNINDATAATTIYVDGSLGTDSLEKGSSAGAGAYKTIQYAIDQVKRLNLAVVYIRIAAGTYNESVSISYRFGGRLILVGNSDADTIITGVSAINCNIIQFQNFSFENNCNISNCAFFETSNVSTTGINKTYNGISTTNTKGIIFGGILANRNSGLTSINSEITLENVMGSSNNVGISNTSSTIRKSTSTTLTGTTPHTISGGGQILT